MSDGIKHICTDCNRYYMNNIRTLYKYLQKQNVHYIESNYKYMYLLRYIYLLLQLLLT